MPLCHRWRAHRWLMRRRLRNTTSSVSGTGPFHRKIWGLTRTWTENRTGILGASWTHVAIGNSPRRLFLRSFVKHVTIYRTWMENYYSYLVKTSADGGTSASESHLYLRCRGASASAARQPASLVLCHPRTRHRDCLPIPQLVPQPTIPTSQSKDLSARLFPPCPLLPPLPNPPAKHTSTTSPKPFPLPASPLPNQQTSALAAYSSHSLPPLIPPHPPPLPGTVYREKSSARATRSSSKATRTPNRTR